MKNQLSNYKIFIAGHKGMVGTALTNFLIKLSLLSETLYFKLPLWTPWLSAKKTSFEQFFLKLFNVSIEKSVGLGI